jgi:hypothetical protein
MKTRERRRDRTWRKAQRAKREHRRVVHRTGTMPGAQVAYSECRCWQSEWYLKKGKAVGCNCRHRRHGNPKVGNGICTRSMDWRPAVEARIAGKRFCKRWAAGELPEEE